MYGLFKNNARCGTGGDLVRKELYDIGSIFNNFFDSSIFKDMNEFTADIRQNENEYIMEAELPGVKKEDIKLSLENNILSLSVTKNESFEDKNCGCNNESCYIVKERRFGTLSRKFEVDSVKEDEITAKYVDGVLTVHLPKDVSKKEGHNIKIN